jgi:hypothetical protein
MMTREIKFRAMTKPPEDFGHFKFKSEMVFGTGVLYDPVNISIQLWVYNESKTFLPEVIGNIHENPELLE